VRKKKKEEEEEEEEENDCWWLALLRSNSVTALYSSSLSLSEMNIVLSWSSSHCTGDVIFFSEFRRLQNVRVSRRLYTQIDDLGGSLNVGLCLD